MEGEGKMEVERKRGKNEKQDVRQSGEEKRSQRRK